MSAMTRVTVLVTVLLALLQLAHAADIEKLMFKPKEITGRSSTHNNATTMFAQCTERCKYKHSCDLCRDAAWPAPFCTRWADTPATDIYYKKAAGQPAAQVQKHLSYDHTINFATSQVDDPELRELVRKNRKSRPMMWPDEFEYVTKTLAAFKPENYLEWGSGRSTAWYPLFARHSHVIENHPPWCAKVQENAVVRHMVDSKRLIFHCLQPKREDGEAPQTEKLGVPQTAEDVAAFLPYILEVEKLGVAKIDAALVDGRFRVACALRLLEFIGDDSIVIIHDFWFRAGPKYTQKVAQGDTHRVPGYNIILKYYKCIGRSRSVGVFKRRKQTGVAKEEQIPSDWREIYKSYIQNPL